MDGQTSCDSIVRAMHSIHSYAFKQFRTFAHCVGQTDEISECLLRLGLQLKILVCKRLASYFRMKVTQSKSVAMSSSVDHAENLDGACRLLDRENNHFAAPDEQRPGANFNNTELLLMRICTLLETRLRSAAEEREKADVDEEMKNDWKLAAAVIDRICFLAFSFLFVGGTTVFFLIFWLGP